MKTYEKPIAELIDLIPTERIMVGIGDESVEDWGDEGEE